MQNPMQSTFAPVRYSQALLSTRLLFLATMRRGTQPNLATTATPPRAQNVALLSRRHTAWPDVKLAQQLLLEQLSTPQRQGVEQPSAQPPKRVSAEGDHMHAASATQHSTTCSAGA
jgi:hypothetical protein